MQASTSVDYGKLAGASKPVPKGVAEWIGQKPDDLVPGIEYEQVTKLTTDGLLNEEIVVTGYSPREGKKGQFFMVCCVPKSLGQPAVFSIGGEVVMRKIKEAGDKKLLPILGKLIKSKGKKSGNDFYDLVSLTDEQKQ